MYTQTPCNLLKISDIPHSNTSGAHANSNGNLKDRFRPKGMPNLKIRGISSGKKILTKLSGVSSLQSMVALPSSQCIYLFWGISMYSRFRHSLVLLGYMHAPKLPFLFLTKTTRPIQPEGPVILAVIPASSMW